MNYRDKLQKFSIRKYAVGTFSTLIATLVFLGTHTDQAHASENTNAAVEKAQQNTESQTSRDKNSNPNDAITIQNDQTSDQTVEINKQSKFVDKTSTEKKALETQTSEKEITNSTSTSIKEKIEESSPVTKEEKTNELKEKSSPIVGKQSSNQSKQKVKFSSSKSVKQIDDKIDTPRESKSDNRQKIDSKNISKLTNLTQEIQSKLLEVETIEPSNPHIEEAKKLTVESSSFTQSSNVSQQSLLDLVTRLEQTRNSLANVITRSQSGKRDPRNGQQIEKGTNFRFTTLNGRWNAGRNVIVYQRNYASLPDGRALGTGQQKNGVEGITSRKTVMRAYYKHEGNSKYLVYDVFFNNDGVNFISPGSQQRLGMALLLPYKVMKLNSDGSFASDSVRNLSYAAYEKRSGRNSLLSESPSDFIIDPDNSTQMIDMLRSNQHDFGHTTFYLSFGVRPGRSFNSDANEYFHSNRNNPDLRKAVEDQRGIFSGWNYGIGIQVDPNHPEGANRAYHMHLEVKLRDNVTTAELENAWSYANTAAMGGVSKSAYTVLSGRILPEDGALPSIENQPPVKPTINSDLVGKATTTTVIDVSTDPNTKVEIFDKNGNKIGTGTTDSSGHAYITPTRPIPEGNVTAKAYNHSDESKVSTSDPKFATDTIPPTTPVINTRLVYKAGTLTPIDVSTDPNTQVALIDKNGRIFGAGTTDSSGHVIITPDRVIPEGNVTAKATDNALHPNSSVSIPVQATTLIPVMKPVINTDVAGKAFSSPVIDITSTPNTRVELLDKNNNVIGRGITGSNGHVNITPDHYLFEGNITAKAYDQTDETNNATSDPRHVTDTTPPRKPVINTNLVNKVGTRTPIDVSTDVLTRVEIFDENGKSYGVVLTEMDGHGIITPREPLPLGKIYARATDGAETPNSIDSDHVPVTDTIPPTVPTVDTDLTGKATTLTPITVTTDPNTRVDLIDKNGHIIGTGTTDGNGHVIITPTTPIVEGNVIAKAYDPANNVSTSAPRKATDTTPPTKPRVTSPLGGKAGTTDPVTVTTDPNTNVQLLDKNGQIIGTGTTDSSGRVNITPTRPIPEGNVTAKAIDNAEHPNSSTSDPVKATDTTPPTKPRVTSPLGGKAGTTDPVTVTTDPNTNVQLLDTNGQIIGTGTTDSSGRVNITPTRPIPEGNVTAKAIDNAEHPNSSTSDPVKATDTTPPTKPRVTTPLGGKATTLTPVEVTTDPNTSVQLLDKDGRVIGSGTTGANGRVTITPTRPIPEGNVTAKATDNAEHPNSSTSDPVKATDTTPPTKPRVTTPLGGKATTLTPIEVTTDPNTSVQLLDKDGRVIGSGTTGANGRVTITPTRPIPEGNVTAKAYDNAEHPNVSTSEPKKATDTTPPTEPVVTNDLTGKATTKTPITVTTDPNTHVDLLDKDNHVIGSGTTDSNGRVTITPTVPIPEGNVRAKATDNAEHPNSSLSQPKKATDTTPPGSPIVNTDLTGKATTRTPVDVSSDPNTRIELLDKDNHVIGSGTTDSNGRVTITPTVPIPEGNVRAKATDNAEHPNSSLSQPKKATDTTPPGSPIVNTDLTGKATTKTPVDVSSDPNTRIELLDKDNHVIGTGTTGANGHVIITPTQPIPEGNVTAKAYDNAEHPNSSTSQPKKATDTTPPTEPVVTNDLTGKATTKTPITVTTDPNTHVDLLDKDNNVIGSGTTDSNGRVTITPTVPIPEGNVRAKATDNAEHPNSSLSQPKKATDTTPPGSPIVNTDLTGKATTKTPVDVSSDPNTRIELLDKDNHVIGSGTTGANGHVIITPTQPIPEGNVTAKAYDNAEHPNVSTSEPKKATDTTPPTAPVVTSDLTGKATTTDPVEVTTDPNTKVELLDKDGNVIGSGTTDNTGHVMITPTKPIPEGNVTAKAYDNAEHPNSSTSQPKKATDTTPPTAPVVTSDLTGKATTTDPVEVTTDPNTKVELLDKDGNVIGSGTTDNTGHVTITPTKPIPEGNVTAKATDNAEHPNSSTSQPKKATDTTPPTAPLVTSDLTGEATTTDPVEVTTDPNTKVELLDKDGNVIGSGTTDNTGHVTITPTKPIPEGNVTAKAYDNAEHPNSSTSQPKKATDTTPPTAPVVTSDLTGKATTTDPVEVTTDPNTKVELLDKDGNVIGSGTTDNTGHVTITPTKPIPEGNVTAKATDNAEHPNSSTSQPKKATDTTPPTAPLVTSDLTGKATTTDPVEVTTDPNTKVELLDKDGNVIGSGTTDNTGHVMITPTKPIPEGNVTAKAYDNAEHPNSSTSQPKKATDTTPPTAPVVTSDLTGKATTTDPVEVTTDPNTKVELLDKDGNVIGSGTTDNTGHVMITPTKPIPEGNVTAKAYDNAEHPNSSTSQPKKATDTTPPTAPVVTSDLTGKATTTDPVEVTTDPNTKVELLDKDGNVIGSGTTDNTGHVTITPTKPIPEGNVSAKAYDNAEVPNVATSQPKKATDTTPPTTPTLDTDLGGKAGTQTPITVTTDPNTHVDLLDKDGNIIGSGTTDDTGHVTITPTKPIPEGNVTAKATDNAEHPNSSTSQPKKATDLTPPVKPSVVGTLDGKAGTKDPVEVVTDPNTKVELLDKDGNVIGSGTTDSTGHATITSTVPIPEGNVTVKATDNAEHPNSSTSDPVKATDTTPPTVPTLDTDLGGKAGTQTPITVTTDPNTKVELLDKDSNIIGSSTTDDTGHVTITPTKPIPEGNVTAKATDNAEHPNSSTSQPKKATDLTPPVKPSVVGTLDGKAGTKDPVEVVTDPNTKVELLDKDGNVIGSGTTDSTGHATITPTVPIPEGNVTVKATDNAEHPNSSTSDPVKATDTTPPTVPTLDTDLGGKAGTQTPITVTTDPNTHVDLLDKDGNIIGSGTTDDTGHVTITPTKPIPEGNVTAKATDHAEHPNSSTSQPKKATDTTPPTAPVVTSDLTGKATTTDPVEVTTDPNTKVELLDKDGNVIGSGTTDDTGHVTITPTKPIPEGNVSAKAYDNAEVPNVATSQPKKATDTTPPTTPTLDTDLGGKAGTQTPITVTTDPNTHVDLLDKDGNIIGSGTTDSTGHATITPTVPIPEGNVTVKATDNAEHPNSSTSQPKKATDTTPPTAPVVTSDLTGKATTTDPVEVTTDPNTHVDLLDKDGNIIGSGTTDDTGHVTITPTKPIPEGNVTAKATDDAEYPNSSTSQPKKATDTTPPTAPVVTSDLTGKATTTDPVEVTTDPNTKVELLDKDGNVIGSGTTDDTGHVTITPTRPIPVGNVSAKAYDNAEVPNVATSQPKKATDTTPPTTPTLDTDLGGKAGTQTPITVTTDPNTHVDLLDKDGNIIGSGTTGDTGHVTITPTKPIPEGNVTAKATDNAEHPNSSTSQPKKATDLTPPVKPSVVGTLDGKAGTKDPVEVVTDPNTKVELLDKDGNIIGSGTTDSTGHATITPTVPIPEGNVIVKATDNAEHPNSSTSDPVKATDTTPPTVPALDTDLGGKAGTQTPITVTTDPNTHVDLLDKDGNIIGSGTTGDTGHVTITPTKPIPEGNVTAKATDNAEHPNSSTSQPKKATDTTPPTAPVVTSDLTGKATTTDPVEVTTDPNTKVELLDKDGNVIGSGTTDSNGHVTITPTRPIPVGDVSAKAYDNAEVPNVATSQPKKATDTTPPTTPTLDTDLGGKAGTQTPITVTTDPNTHVDLLDKDGNIIGSGTTDSNGHVTITPTKPIPEGNVSAKATDNAEHPNSSTSQPKKATDLTPPVKPSVVGTLDGKAGTKDPVEVVTDPNTKVELLDKDGNVIGSGTTDSTGHATITPTVPIPEGNVTVKATDNAEHPNSSTSDPVKATDTTPPTAPVVTSDLTGKATTTDPVEVTTDPNTHVDLLDKDGNIIGSGTTDSNGHVTITPTRPIPEGDVYAKAIDNAEHPNISISKPVKATKLIVKSHKKEAKNGHSKENENHNSRKSKNTIRDEKGNKINTSTKKKVKDLPSTGKKELTNNSLPYIVTLLGSFALLISRKRERKDNNRNK
ncbi:YSIRK-type signal peptide-containing protein [Staphylococcus haemolyticus]|uniref:YSIRK-type signal peptide-containing protein n=9 Tax=Staphylococcus TaxID=1279 RepID=UPI000E000807|nr:YSIRK-type signal peptide-containing protein [Staphylococcus haemolyticus]QCY38473.1 YSIRK-type signal peptide-containing protein [Staphylococcus haemolyticus]QXA67219.1 YSIRK-type signal peptide-containing protein [Staphylococcus haemolyticus]SUM39211.1 truncated cell surface fibronectin-binding protein [Staphylococcus haemolyticus]